ncbi:MAG: GNAT family N-acetyltransferase [Ferruginibacter sp.]
MSQIREAGLHDIEVIIGIARKTWPVSYKQMITTEQIEYMLGLFYTRQSLIEQMQVLNHRFFLCYDEHRQYNGFLSVGLEDREAHQFKIHKLYVLPEKQTAGIGKQLLKHCFSHVQADGGHSIVLQVNRQNSAVSFYEKMGFSIWKSADFDIGSGFSMNDYIMRLDLPST